MIYAIILAVLLSSPVFAQPVKGIQKQEAIKLSLGWAQSSHPPIDVEGMLVEAVFVKKENQWIVGFSDPETPEMIKYMFRVEATSGDHPQFVRESQMDRYTPYFSKAAEASSQEQGAYHEK